MSSSRPEMTETPPSLAGGAVPAAGVAPLKAGRTVIVLGVIVVLAALAGLFPRWKEGQHLRREAADMAIPTVLVVSPQPSKSAAPLNLPAEVRAWMEAPIYARANGFLKRWLVDIGAKVEAGQLLAEIDTPELNQELARARAELAQAQAALALSRVTAERWADLLKTASVSEQEAAEKQSDLALKSATVEASQANVRRLEEMLSFARVTAPFAGAITVRRTDVGELIAPGTVKELFRLAQTNPLRVYVRVPQSAARQISPGQRADLTVPELPSRVFAARVVRTSGVMDAQSRTLLTELEVDNSNGEILAGSYAQVRFPEAKTEAALTLPSNALLFRAEGPQVGVVRADGVVELRSVRLGRDFGATMEIVEGVGSKDEVILNPSDSLAAGAKVRVASASTPPKGDAVQNAKRSAKE